MMQRECMDSDERIKGLRKLVEALRKEAQFKDGVHHFVFVYALKN